jgi:hypothetical protein
MRIIRAPTNDESSAPTLPSNVEIFFGGSNSTPVGAAEGCESGLSETPPSLAS